MTFDENWLPLHLGNLLLQLKNVFAKPKIFLPGTFTKFKKNKGQPNAHQDGAPPDPPSLLAFHKLDVNTPHKLLQCAAQMRGLSGEIGWTSGAKRNFVTSSSLTSNPTIQRRYCTCCPA